MSLILSTTQTGYYSKSPDSPLDMANHLESLESLIDDLDEPPGNPPQLLRQKGYYKDTCSPSLSGEETPHQFSQA